MYVYCTSGTLRRPEIFILYICVFGCFGDVNVVVVVVVAVVVVIVVY